MVSDVNLHPYTVGEGASKLFRIGRFEFEVGLAGGWPAMLAYFPSDVGMEKK